MAEAYGAQTLEAMTVAGIMSGTSADGIDVAIVRIEPGADHAGRRLKVLHEYSTPYPADLRSKALQAMDAQHTSTAELARLHWRLGMEYASAAREAILGFGRPVQLVGCHGQTLYHQGASTDYAGEAFACTWQLGEMSLVAAAAGLPVVSNFRSADMVAGGQGAPLVSYLDYVLFRSGERNRVLQNLGGIGNLTAMPAGASAAKLLAFDTGPANMIVDALMQKLFGSPFDDGGSIAAIGTVSQMVVKQCMKDAFFHEKPPKSAGREQFGERYAADFLRTCHAAGLGEEDMIATATALTVESIRVAFERFVQPMLKPAQTDYVVAGGGSRNHTLMQWLQEALLPFGVNVTTTDTFGVPSQSKEAAAFALMAYETWHHRPSNVPAATGALRPVILGQITPAPSGIDR